MIPFIDLHSQQKQISDEINAAIACVLEHGHYIMGPEIEQLEETLSLYTGSHHAITVSSGTDALLIALMALGIGRGDEVITVPYTWISTAETIALLGATPVFVDVEPGSWNMDPAQLDSKISSRTKCIMPVGIFGQTANMRIINDVASRHGNIPVIEDGAQSFGATHHSRRSCNLSTIGCTSFFPSKPLGCYGDGGAVFTDDDQLAKKMRQIRIHGQESKHHHPSLGINGRLDTIQAAILLCKLKLFDTEISERQKIANKYGEALSSADSITEQQIENENKSVYAQYTVLSENREDIARRLKQNRIPSVSYYKTPLHLQPVFSYLGYKQGDFPVSEKISQQGLSLPMSPWMNASDIECITDTLQSLP